MNFNQRFECLTCETLIDCRMGMSNRDVQPFRFACPSCGSKIDIKLSTKKKGKFKGVKLVDFEGPFEGDNPFVDLHIDFPVSFGKYIMGETPFMRAIDRIGHENYFFHRRRLDALNVLYPKADDLERIFKLSSKNPDLFSRLCKSKFSEEARSLEAKDINLALYCVIAKVFFPFSLPDDNADSVEQHMRAIHDSVKKNKEAFNNFISEIIDTSFLKNLQHDCLEIYPRILRSEIALRPALFLDFDEKYDSEVVAFRVSADDFQTYKDLYKDISEIMSRQLVLIAGLNNLLQREDHNTFKDVGKNTPKSLHKFADVAYGLKLNHLDDCWYEIDEEVTDNQLRNSIAHYKAEYDETSQVITYFPRKEGIKQEKSESMYFLDFMRKILISYREMHSLNQLIKCLLNYYWFMYPKGA